MYILLLLFIFLLNIFSSELNGSEHPGSAEAMNQSQGVQEKNSVQNKESVQDKEKDKKVKVKKLHKKQANVSANEIEKERSAKIAGEPEGNLKVGEEVDEEVSEGVNKESKDMQVKLNRNKYLKFAMGYASTLIPDSTLLYENRNSVRDQSQSSLVGARNFILETGVGYQSQGPFRFDITFQYKNKGEKTPRAAVPLIRALGAKGINGNAKNKNSKLNNNQQSEKDSEDSKPQYGPEFEPRQEQGEQEQGEQEQGGCKTDFLSGLGEKFDLGLNLMYQREYGCPNEEQKKKKINVFVKKTQWNSNNDEFFFNGESQKKMQFMVNFKKVAKKGDLYVRYDVNYNNDKSQTKVLMMMADLFKDELARKKVSFSEEYNLLKDEAIRDQIKVSGLLNEESDTGSMSDGEGGEDHENDKNDEKGDEKGDGGHESTKNDEKGDEKGDGGHESTKNDEKGGEKGDEDQQNTEESPSVSNAQLLDRARVNLDLNIYYDLKVLQSSRLPITPFVMLGCGISHAIGEDLVPSTTNLNYQLGAGLAYELTEAVYLDVSYKYKKNIKKISSGSSIVDNLDAKAVHSVTAGVRVLF